MNKPNNLSAKKWPKIEERLNKKWVPTGGEKAIGGFATTPDGHLLNSLLLDDSIQRVEEDINTLSKEESALKSMRFKNLSRFLHEKREIDNQISVLETLLRRYKQSKYNNNDISTRDANSDKILDHISSLKQNLESIIQSNPEAFVAVNLMDFKENINNIREGKLANVEYVSEMGEWLMDKMSNSEPVFLHGHLGAGKTELALNFAKKRMIHFWRDKMLDEWMNENNYVSADETAQQKQIIENEIRIKIATGDVDMIEKTTPLLIAGSKDFSLEDLYIEKSLKLTKLNGNDIIFHKEKIDKVLSDWRAKYKNELQDIEEKNGEEARQNEERIAAEQILSLHVMNNTAFGTEVEKIKREMCIAMEKGLPIIIDEMNAIPATILVSLNDVLTKRPGEIAYIPGGDNIKIADGFSIIMTGNLNTSKNVEYAGINDLNPAFLSRVEVKEYNYLPQNDEGNVFEQSNPTENQLFNVICSMLANRDGSLSLPNGAVDKLFKLAQLARTTQDVFSGKFKKSQMRKTDSGDTKEPRLQKSVLSIRAIISILKKWNKGQVIDLDFALWNEFISSVSVPEDQHYIYEQAQRYGFFTAADGWKDTVYENRNTPLSFAEIRNNDYQYNRQSDITYSPRDTVKLLYGKIPERTEFPDIVINLDKEMTEQDKEIAEQVAKIEQAKKETNVLVQTMDHILKQKGCYNTKKMNKKSKK